MKHVMIDLETLSTKPDAGIISIGAVKWEDNDNRQDRFYEVVSMQDVIDLGFSIDGEVIEWWSKQLKKAKEVLIASTNHGLLLADALDRLYKFIHSDERTLVWGDGAAFDNVVLKNAYNKLGMDIPWSYKDDMCYRTLREMYDTISQPKFVGTEHNALDDAINQANHLKLILKHIEEVR